MARIHTILLAALVGVSGALTSDPSAALDRCKVKTDKRDGTLHVSARDVQGELRYGFSPGLIAGTFPDADECIADGIAKKCTFAGQGNPKRIVPPPYCTLYLEDDAGNCQPRVKRCTPGARPICPPGMSQLGAECIEDTFSLPPESDVVTAVEITEANAICHARGRSLCSQETLLRCDNLNFQAGTYGTCGDVTDGGIAVWTSKSNSSSGQSIFSELVVYEGDNAVVQHSINDARIHYFFCCAPLGAP